MRAKLMRSRIDGNRGQSTVQVAVCLPLFLLFLAFSIQIGWVLFCNVALDASLEHVRYAVDSGDIGSGEQAAQTIADEIVEMHPLLASGELVVSEARIEAVEGRAQTSYLPDADFEEYSIATVNSAADRISVKATVTYEPAQIFPLPQRIVFTRHIDSLKEYNMSFEVG